MHGKIVIVTGATNGIGEVTARELAAKGAEVVLISRNVDKLKNTVQIIQQKTGNQNVSYIQADLSSLADIRKAAAEFLERYDRLDVLVNNAGGIFYERKESVDGYEMTFALNHLNYFLLTNLLLDVLTHTAEEEGDARIINVSSGAHHGANLNWDDLQRKQNYNSFGAYSQSKLMNLLFTYELARRLEDTGVTVNALHPGFVSTGFNKNARGILGGLARFAENVFAISPEDGAKTSIYLASSPEVSGVTGQYWNNSQVASSSAASHDCPAQRRLWEISAEMTGLHEMVSP